jgi:hypothetical protein
MRTYSGPVRSLSTERIAVRKRPLKWAGRAIVTTVVSGAMVAAATTQPVSAAPRGSTQRSVPSTAEVSRLLAALAAAENEIQIADYPVTKDDDGTLASRVANGPAATLRNGASVIEDGAWNFSSVERAVQLDGVDDFVDSPTSVPTAAPYTVAAWVNPARIDRQGVVLSQDGGRVSGFQLRVNAAGKWQFAVPQTDADAATWDVATGPAAAANKWTHLTGVYDEAAGQIRLYVNGTKAATATHTVKWAASGGLVAGRGRTAAQPKEFLTGKIDQVEAWQGALGDRHIAEQAITPSAARNDRCDIGHWLHVGGPEVKAVAGKALAGTDYDRRETNFAPLGSGPLHAARSKDDETYRTALFAQTDRYTAWGAVIKPYTVWGTDFDTFHDVPEYGDATHRFLLERNDTTFHSYFDPPAPPKPNQAALDRALAVAAEMRAKDPLFAPQDWQVKAWSAYQVERFLRYGGYPTAAPAEGSLEYRTEVESIKLAWAACEVGDPFGTTTGLNNATPGVLADLVDTARGEWATELAAQATQRNDIVAAETQAMKDVRVASQAMVEAQGQAWVAGQLLKWQKYWAGRPKTDPNYPKAADFTRAKTDLTAAQNRVSAQVTVAKNAATSAQAQATKATTGLTQAATIAKNNKWPLYRGLQYAQQSAQVTKASAAAAQAAFKATETTLNAVKATNADAAALRSLALTQQSALQAEFRRVAAQEAAAQAKAAAQAAAEQAAQAEAAAVRAKNDRIKAEAAEAKAKQGAADARNKRIVAERERDVATAARQRADAERAKAGQARGEAERQQSVAADARGRAGSAEETARAKEESADEAEFAALVARDEAVAAEQRRDTATVRARTLEAQAAAAAGREDAQDARAAANEAKAAADQASSAAVSARAAANRANDAALSARAEATRANAAAQRSRAAADGAEAAAATTRSAWLTAQAATADAIDAAEQAANNVKAAEAEAKKAAEAAVTARQEADAAQKAADEATAESARTAGWAYATAEAATAARDSALEAVTAANEAIAAGTPFQATDASAGLAVLVGQSAKTIAEQQAEAATAKAVEAAKAAADAKAAAAKAQADAKLAAEAAAAAAVDAAAAAESVKKARASAAAAARDAEACQRATDNAAEYYRQAQADALAARSASFTADQEAKAADAAATDAERDASAAHSAASSAETDASAARDSASRADKSATEAEKSAENADGYAREAQESLARAEEQDRLDQLARSEVIANGNGPTGGTMTTDEEALLREQCGEACVQEYRDALAQADESLLDWVKANGGQILLDLVGWTALKDCLTKGDVEGCIWTLINGVALLLLVGKIPGVTKAIYRLATGVGKYFNAVAAAGEKLKKFRKIITAGRAVKGSLVITGTKYSASERAVAEWLAKQGRKVELRDPVNIQNVRTSDLVVDGIKYDVYTPISTNPKAIIGKTAKKHSQVNGGGVVIDLTKCGLKPEDFGNVLARVNGYIKSWGKTPMSDIIFYTGG